MPARKPIGIFDSGVGGISVLKHIHQILPAEDLLYCADSYYAPYGNKSPDIIRERAVALAELLLANNAKALVVACNTATAAAVADLRSRYTVPIIGMEPAVKPAAAATRTGVLGVLATVGTLKSAQFAGLLESYGKDVRVVTQGCPGLVERIEQGDLTSAETRELLQHYLGPLISAGADTVVLGCTHYPFVRELVSEIVGPSVTIIDTGAAVARHLRHRLHEQHLLNPEEQTGSVTFWTNSEDPQAAVVISRLWGSPVTVHRMKTETAL